MGLRRGRRQPRAAPCNLQRNNEKQRTMTRESGYAVITAIILAAIIILSTLAGCREGGGTCHTSPGKQRFLNLRCQQRGRNTLRVSDISSRRCGYSSGGRFCACRPRSVKTLSCYSFRALGRLTAAEGLGRTIATKKPEADRATGFVLFREGRGQGEISPKGVSLQSFHAAKVGKTERTRNFLTLSRLIYTNSK